MKKVWGICLALTLLVACKSQVATKKASSPQQSPPPLILTGSIPLPGAEGRFDHFSFDPSRRVFLSALGSNTEEVINIVMDVRSHSITGIPEPQGVVYVPEFNKLFVASRRGKLYIYDGTSFHLITAIDFHGDVDNLRYDAAEKRVYAGYGDGDAAAIRMVDAKTNQLLSEEYKTGAHPESFQLETSGPNIYVNLPDLNQIAVINRTTHAITRWHLSLEENFPMALDEGDHRLFVVTRTPPRLAVFDTASGHMVASLPCVADSDDMYYDAAGKRIYVSGGAGFLGVFQQKSPDQYQLLVKIPTPLGARTSGYFGKIGKKHVNRFYLAVPASATREAEVLVYTVED
ncbi:MAG: YncE family protein [Terriglobia bacterium]